MIENCAPSRPSPRTWLVEKIKPCRGAPKFPHAPTPLLSDQVGTRSQHIHPTVCRRGFRHDVSQTQSKHMGASPLSYPQRSRPVSETDPEVCNNGCKRLGTRKCDWACRYRENIPHWFQNCIGAPRAIVNKEVKHGISTG